MNNLLITGGTSSYAFRIMNLLSNNFIISLGTSNDIPNLVNTNFIKLPANETISFVHEILKLALANNLDYILPIEESQIRLLSQNLTLFEEYGIKILTPNFDEIGAIQLTSAPNRASTLTILIDGIDILNNKKTAFSYSGCGFIDEINEEFILVAIQ